MGRNVIIIIKTEIYQSSAKHVQKISLVLTLLHTLNVSVECAETHLQKTDVAFLKSTILSNQMFRFSRI